MVSVKDIICLCNENKNYFTIESSEWKCVKSAFNKMAIWKFLKKIFFNYFDKTDTSNIQPNVATNAEW